MNGRIDIKVNEPVRIDVDDLAEPLTCPVDAFLSPEYAARERDRLWPKVWQHAGRVEELKQVGDYITYEIGDDSIIVVRTGLDTLKAFHNVCPHRGRRLIDTPCGRNNACGNKLRIVCRFHGWTFDVDGRNTFILDKEDWKGGLDEARTSLSEVKVGTWGGWIFVNMDPEAASLADYLGDVFRILAPFELEKMRYKWRQWGVFDCNWKIALEAFMEPYHVASTHSQMPGYGQHYAYSRAYGLHGVNGIDERLKMEQSKSITRAGKGRDLRVSINALQNEIYKTLNNAGTTETFINAAKRLLDELPEGTPGDEVIRHWVASARADDAARGVIWPDVTPEQRAEAGYGWHVFPNMVILPGITFALCFRARPYGDNPDKCIFESYAWSAFHRAGNRRPSGSTRTLRRSSGVLCSRRTSRTWPRCRRV